jgi:GLPGLI family protein
MKTLFFSIGLLLFTVATAQKNDRLLFRATYQFSTVPNPDQPNKSFHSFFYLDVSGHKSFFYDPIKKTGDSIMYEDMNMTNPPPGYVFDFTRYKRNNPGFQVLQDLDTRKIKVWDDVGIYFSYEEENLFPHWQILADTMRLMGILANKATTRFRGRSYTAWYTPEIAITTGPWKFSGLPGLILNISDSLNHVRFECSGIENMEALKQPFTQCIVKNDRKTSFKEFSKLRRRRVEDPQGFVASLNAGVNISVNNAGTGSPTTMANKPKYYPIELTDD